MDKATNNRFLEACHKIIDGERERTGIGTLSEKTLHAVLKLYVEPDERYHEIPTNGYVADVRRENQIFEIQTRNFNVLRRKLESFLPLYHVTIVYPIPATKWLSWIDEETGEVTSRRKSPKRGTPYMAFKELYRIKPFLVHENLSLRLLLIDLEESRLLNGWSKDRKKGSVRHDRIPVELVEDLLIEDVKDYMMLIPPELPEQFLAKDFAKAAKIPVGQAQTALLILHFLGLVNRIGKKGNAFIYEINE